MNQLDRFMMSKRRSLGISAGFFERPYFLPKRRPFQSRSLLLPRVHFGMERIADCQVKLVFVRGSEHQAKIVAIGPISLGADLFLHPVEEGSAWKRIRERNPYVIWPRAANQIYRLLDVLPLLPGVAELQEIAGANPCVPKPCAGSYHFSHAQALVHGIQYALRSGFNAHPYLGAPRP